MRTWMLSIVIGAAACGANAPPSGVGPRDCPGEQLVTVDNDWSGAVDLYAKLEGSMEPRALGMVQGGAHASFVAPAGTREVYAIQAGREVPDALTRNVQRLVRLRFECR